MLSIRDVGVAGYAWHPLRIRQRHWGSWRREPGMDRRGDVGRKEAINQGDHSGDVGWKGSGERGRLGVLGTRKNAVLLGKADGVEVIE